MVAPPTLLSVWDTETQVNHYKVRKIFFKYAGFQKNLLKKKSNTRKTS